MFARTTHRLDFADTLAALPPAPREAGDPLEQMAHAERADLALLRLVLCAALATLALALASSLLGA